jgi:hypothetical protein
VAKAGRSPQEEEDREHLTHFETWGESAPRSTRSKSLEYDLTAFSPWTEARPRKVILTGLPMTADNTLVASLIHGGTIETFKLHPAFELSATKTATVLFADADAAQKYYDTYPNGLAFKHGGRKYVTFVEMGKEVDVLGSLMRGQLEAGASRVVRATGADEDWGMGALLKLAQGKGRKVEGIADYWRDGVRSSHSSSPCDTDAPPGSDNRLPLHRYPRRCAVPRSAHARLRMGDLQHPVR